MIIRIPLLIGLLIGLLASSSSSGGVPLHYANTLGLLELTFSLYGAELNDWDSLASIVLETSDFLCVEVGVRVQDDASCQSGGTATNQSVVALKTSTSVVEQGGSDKFNLEWTSWTEEFWILELSSEIIEQAGLTPRFSRDDCHLDQSPLQVLVQERYHSEYGYFAFLFLPDKSQMFQPHLRARSK